VETLWAFCFRKFCWLTVKLSERGRDAAIAQWVGRGKIAAALLAEMGPAAVSTLRRGLAVLARMGAQQDRGG
jgi:hypothetical protein